ncbi:hypothetical protein Q7M45_03230 [Candidatus Liberibacter asiaticus]
MNSKSLSPELIRNLGLLFQCRKYDSKKTTVICYILNEGIQTERLPSL